MKVISTDTVYLKLNDGLPTDIVAVIVPMSIEIYSSEAWITCNCYRIEPNGWLRFMPSEKHPVSWLLDPENYTPQKGLIAESGVRYRTRVEV